MERIQQIERILRECFWETTISKEDFEAYLKSEDNRLRQYVFRKILLNSTQLLLDLSLFPRKDLAMLLSEITFSGFQKEYYWRRKAIAEIYFLDYPNNIKDLKWPA